MAGTCIYSAFEHIGKTSVYGLSQMSLTEPQVLQMDGHMLPLLVLCNIGVHVAECMLLLTQALKE